MTTTIYEGQPVTEPDSYEAAMHLADRQLAVADEQVPDSILHHLAMRSAMRSLRLALRFVREEQEARLAAREEG